jgi:Fe-S-cluster containining protein
MDPSRWKTSEQRRELLRMYAEVDELLSPYACDASTECCRFGITGREPYPTKAELLEVGLAIRAGGFRLDRAGGERPKRGKARALPVLGGAGVASDERRCPLLSDEGRCRIYASRPFGCRTFFCDRVRGGRLPRSDIQRLSRQIADLSARVDPVDPHARPLTRVLERLAR